MTGTESGRDPDVILDISRLMSRVLYRAPTGIDRVELAYARHLAERLGARLHYSGIHPVLRRYGRLQRKAVEKFLAAYETRWADTANATRRDMLRFAAPHLVALRPRRVPASDNPAVLVQPSPHHLGTGGRIEAILRRENARLITFVHDLIPIEFPEYARDGGAAAARARIETVLAHSAAILTNSAATRDSLLRIAHPRQQDIPIRHALLGTERFTMTGVADGAEGASEPDGSAVAQSPSKPYFVCLGTIEPRKNHLLLLNVWRDLVKHGVGGEMPALVLIGRRGWENENIVDMLDRCPSLTGYVDEYGAVSDAAVHALLRGAQALLLPSFAEGYGMPVAEAMALGTPVICSDLPALREASGGLADYLHPLDGEGWRSAILDYTQPHSQRRAAQIEQLAGYSPPSWEAHMDVAMELIWEAALQEDAS